MGKKTYRVALSFDGLVDVTPEELMNVFGKDTSRSLKDVLIENVVSGSLELRETVPTEALVKEVEQEAACLACYGSLELTDEGWIHPATDSVQCHSVDHCTECGLVVDYYSDENAWKHDEFVIVDSEAFAEHDGAVHVPRPAYGSVAIPVKEL